VTFSLRQSVYTGSVNHPAYYPIGTEASYIGTS